MYIYIFVYMCMCAWRSVDTFFLLMLLGSSWWVSAGWDAGEAELWVWWRALLMNPDCSWLGSSYKHEVFMGWKPHLFDLSSEACHELQHLSAHIGAGPPRNPSQPVERNGHCDGTTPDPSWDGMTHSLRACGSLHWVKRKRGWLAQAVTSYVYFGFVCL